MGEGFPTNLGASGKGALLSSVAKSLLKLCLIVWVHSVSLCQTGTLCGIMLWFLVRISDLIPLDKGASGKEGRTKKPKKTVTWSQAAAIK